MLFHMHFEESKMHYIITIINNNNNTWNSNSAKSIEYILKRFTD